MNKIKNQFNIWLHAPAPICKIIYVNMQHNYPFMLFIYVNMQHMYVDMQHNYINMRDNHTT